MNGRVANIAIYVGIPLVWAGLIIAFLYSSYVTQFYREKEKAISVFMWSDVIPQRLIAQFEQETGIKVHLNYYEGNDEMMTKLEFSQGAGYDIIMPSHYMLRQLVRDGHLKRIDKKRLPFISFLDKRSFNCFVDPDSDYAVPFLWDVYGLGIDSTFFQGKAFEPSWELLYKPRYAYRVAMTDEPREIIAVAAQYLFGRVCTLDSDQQRLVKQLLIDQKKYVEAYTDLTLDLLLTSKTCPVVFGPSASIYRARKRAPWVRFVLPREGTVSVMESFAISAHSSKDDYVYAFLNFMYQREAQKAIFDDFGYLPCDTRVLPHLDLSHLGGAEALNSVYVRNIHLIAPLMPRKQLVQLWLSIKAY